MKMTWMKARLQQTPQARKHIQAVNLALKNSLKNWKITMTIMMECLHMTSLHIFVKKNVVCQMMMKYFKYGNILVVQKERQNCHWNQ